MEKFKKLLQQRYQLTDTRMLCALADSITFQHLDKDVKLIVEGETAANIYFLLSGIVRGFYYSENGKEITDCFVYESGDIIASDVPVNNAPSLITEETLVPCEIAALPINKIQELMSLYPEITQTSVYKGYKQDKIEMRGDRAEMSDFPLYLNTVAGGLDRRDQTIGGFSFVVKIYAVPVVEIIG